MVLEKTLESPLDCKEIQPVHPKGDQSWVYTGSTDVEAETPIFGHLMQRADSLEKTLMLGRIGRKIKSDTVSTASPSISHEVMGPDAMIRTKNLKFL